MTVRGARLLAEADVVVYDRAAEAALRWARPDAERIAAGAPAERGTRAGRALDAPRRQGARRPTSSPGSSGAIRSCSTAAPRKRCSSTSRACRSRSCPAFRSRSARRPTPASRSPIRTRATRSCSCAATRTKPGACRTSTGRRCRASTAPGRATRRAGWCRRSCSSSSSTARQRDSPAALMFNGTEPTQRTVTGTIAELARHDVNDAAG